MSLKNEIKIFLEYWPHLLLSVDSRKFIKMSERIASYFEIEEGPQICFFFLVQNNQGNILDFHHERNYTDCNHFRGGDLCGILREENIHFSKRATISFSRMFLKEAV